MPLHIPCMYGEIRGGWWMEDGPWAMVDGPLEGGGGGGYAGCGGAGGYAGLLTC